MSDLNQGKRNFLALDATVLAAKERHEHIKLDVQLNRIRFFVSFRNEHITVD